MVQDLQEMAREPVKDWADVEKAKVMEKAKVAVKAKAVVKAKAAVKVRVGEKVCKKEPDSNHIK